MSDLMQSLSRTAAIGIGATLVLDLWLLTLGRLGMAKLNFAPIGRWVGHILRGRWAHDAIEKAPAIPGEAAWGWATHYAVGVVFAGLLVGIFGPGWLSQPSLVPALTIGACTVIAPLFVMQPAMGSGVAFSKTRSPLASSLRSLINHAVFGIGLYLSALVIARLWQ
jgi:hypothetical protein